MYVRVELLLDHMHRRSDEDFARFRAALRTVRQEHILRDYLEQPSNFPMLESGNDDENSTAAIIHPSDQQHQPETLMIESVNDEIEDEPMMEGATPQQQDQCKYCQSTLQSCCLSTRMTPMYFLLIISSVGLSVTTFR